MKKWNIIYDYLFNLILKNELNNNNYLPSENSLKVKFKVSSQPIRTAFSKLISEKLVIPIQGKGYKIVKQENNVLFSFSSLFPNAISKYSYICKVKVDDFLRNNGFHYENFVHKIIVKRYLNNKLFVFQISYIADSLLKNNLDIEYINKKGLINFFKNHLKTNMSYSIKKILSIHKKEVKEIGIEELSDNNLILDKGMLFGNAQLLIEYRESYYNLQNFDWSFIEYFN